MIISHKYKFIFIKTRKTAGTSLEVYLSNFCGEDDILTPIFPHVEPHMAKNYEGYFNHISASEVKAKVGEKIWKEYFVFCVERNPWDKTLSYYHMINKRNGDTITFEQYLSGSDFCIDFPAYTSSDNSKEIIVDKVLRYENLNEELAVIFKELGIPFDGELNVRAKSEYRTDKSHYSSVYSPEQARLIADAFRNEIELFGYSYQTSLQKPIFIHSLFRSGSTYIFDVFRRNKEYWCYQEPLNEIALKLKDTPEDLLQPDASLSVALRHKQLEKPYFYELYQVKDGLTSPLESEIIYQRFFDEEDLEHKTRDYVDFLVRVAKGRPVIQECRTFGRMNLFKKYPNSLNIYLWRNPWDQWWSYKVNDYFDIANLLILNAKEVPLVFELFKSSLSFEANSDINIEQLFNFYAQKKLSAENSYRLFYLLWIYGLIKSSDSTDTAINIDQLSLSQDYKKQVQDKLSKYDINDLDFSACKSPIGSYGKEDIEFFRTNESFIHNLMIQAGFLDETITQIENIRDHFDPHRHNIQLSFDELQNDAMRARSLARRYSTEISNVLLQVNEIKHNLNQEVQKANEALLAKEQEVQKANEALLFKEKIESSIIWKAYRYIRLLGNKKI